jgi:hypothetical protein
MAATLAQFADLDPWIQIVIVGVAAVPLIILVVMIVFGLGGWARDPRKMWTKRK